MTAQNAKTQYAKTDRMVPVFPFVTERESGLFVSVRRSFQGGVSDKPGFPRNPWQNDFPFIPTEPAIQEAGIA